MRPQLQGTSPMGATAGFPTAIDFPSQRREKIDWHKLASVDLHDLSNGCSMEILQENLSHVAFCDAEAEFDLSTTSGQRSLLKMFRLSQLIVQYLFLSQDFIETQLREAQDEAAATTDKYQQIKVKLLQQVEEAKKMRATNRNMRETVKYVNSFALTNGIFQALRCPVCTKTFRSRDYLHSHLWRKHPGQANTIVVPQAAHIPQGTHIPQDTHTPPVVHIPSAATLPSGIAMETKEVHRAPDTPLNSAPSVTSPKTNDIDSYRLNEIERKFDAMNDNFSRIIREMEEQKRALERENERKVEEVKKAWEEKANLERGYEAQLEKLGEQISFLQSNNRDQAAPNDNEKFLEFIRRQEDEIKSLRAEVENRAENRVEEIKNLDEVDGLTSELRALKKQMNEQKRQHKQALREMQESLQKDYEKVITSEKAKFREMMKDIAHEEASMAIISRKPPPSPGTPSKKKPLTPSNKATYPPAESSPEHEASSPSTSRLTRTRTIGSTKLHRMDTEELDSDTGTDSETDTSRWTQSDLRVTQLQISSPNTEREECHPENTVRLPSDELSEESTEESERSVSESEESSDTFSLKALLRENPKLWEQMREATAEVLAAKLSALGIDKSDKGLKTDVLTSCLSRLRKDRQELEKKHDNFLELRKRLENEVRAKVDDKIDRVEDTSGKQGQLEQRDGDKKQHSGVFGRMVKNVHSRVREGSKAISSSVSKTSESVKLGVRDIFQANPKSADDVQVIGRGRRVSVVSVASGEKTGDGESNLSSAESGEEAEGPTSARIEVHNETSKSVSRNLFGGGPSGGARPKIGGYFENKTYGKASVEEESDSEWDSDPEYENVRKAQPPERKDSLNVTLEPAELHTTGWEAQKPKPIKLKKAGGENVSSLTRTIELQLSGRKVTKPAGAIDIMGSSGVEPSVPGSSGLGQNLSDLPQHTNPKHSTPYGSQQTLNSPSGSSNTVRTSLWGSADDVNNIRRKETKSLTSQATVHSWDSEDDLNISDIE